MSTAPDTTARLAALLSEHRPRAVGIRDLVECSCGDEATYTPDRAYAAHVAAVLAEAGVGFVAEAERERDRIEALIEASSLGTPEAKAARESVPRSTASAIVIAAKHLARAKRAEVALDDLRSRIQGFLNERVFWQRPEDIEAWARRALLPEDGTR